MKVMSIKKGQPKVTVDVQVENTHSYQLDNGWVVHNTVSQLVDSASGIHPRYSPFYIRRVRLAKTDPLGQFMVANGYKAEEDFYNKSNWVFSFPMKAPEGAVTVSQVNAIQQLELWKVYQDHWCDHKPSITVYVGDDEWMRIGAWVYDNMNAISGVSFLPRDNGTYRQAPYEEITEEQYNQLVSTQQTVIDWTSFREETDTTENSKTLACTNGTCEL
jgi:ribonucleoside-diphosphate reductase alpha chain